LFFTAEVEQDKWMAGLSLMALLRRVNKQNEILDSQVVQFEIKRVAENFPIGSNNR
jgi:hypothetical protein